MSVKRTPSPPRTPNRSLLAAAMPASEPEVPKVWGSAKLDRWSRARAIRAGRKLDYPPRNVPAPTNDTAPVAEEGPSEGNSSGEEDPAAVGCKPIYLISDGTGWTAEHCVTVALGQFERCLVNRAGPVNTHLFSGVDNADRLLEIVKQAAEDGALILYTLVDPSMAEAARNACQIHGVRSTDILSPITEAIAAHLGASPSGLPRGAPGRSPLGGEYFKRMDCVEFTIKQDDGALPQNLPKADIILAGVSRTGKTPLSIYLAQKGYKVANVPIVMGVELPKSLFEVDPRKVFGLTINPFSLQKIRNSRATSLNFDEGMKNSYSKMEFVRGEIEFARKIFVGNPTWPVIDVTGKAIEETAAVILRLYCDRKHKFSMPRIPRRY